VSFRSLTVARIWLLAVLFTSAPLASTETPIMGVDEIKRGMRGIGKTVFRGTRIDTFEVEILSVIKNQGPKSDRILAKVSGHSLEKTGGIQGMSGSPVYIDGKLIGAVAWGYPFALDPVMGITPIGEMLEIMERPEQATLPDAIDPPPSYARLSDPSRPSTIEHGQLTPINAPVYVSGFSPEVVPRLRDELSGYGLVPVQGGGGYDPSLPEATLEPGSSLGVQLVRGDFNLTAIGTVTHVDGDRVVGFGHPMFYLGSSRLPMTTAFIHDVIANQFISFKIGSGGKQVGAITQDRATGIGGVIGGTAELMPTNISVRSSQNEWSYKMEVLRHRMLGPQFIQAAVVSSVLTASKAVGEATVKTRLSLKVEGHPELSFTNIYAGPRGLGEGILGVTRPIQLLLGNPFEEVRVESATFELDIDETTKAASIRSIELDRSRIEPGDRLGLRIEVAPYLGKAETIETLVVVPPHVRKGRLTLRVSSARSHVAQESKRIPGYYRVSSVDALLNVLERERTNNTMIVELIANRPGATVGGLELASLPPSVAAAMKQSRHSRNIRPVNQSVISSADVSTPYVLSGQQIVFLTIGSDGPALRFTPSQPGPTPKKK